MYLSTAVFSSHLDHFLPGVIEGNPHSGDFFVHMPIVAFYDDVIEPYNNYSVFDFIEEEFFIGDIRHGSLFLKDGPDLREPVLLVDFIIHDRTVSLRFRNPNLLF